MKRLFRNILNGSATGLLFQGTFVGLSVGSGNTNAVGPTLSGFFSGSSTSLAGFFNAAFTMALSAGAILAVLQLARAGWLYMSSDAFGTKSRAKEIIQDAVLGLLLLIGIYIILYQINPNLVNLCVLQSLGGACS